MSSGAAASEPRWCTTNLRGIDWSGDPLLVLQAYAVASKDCGALVHENHQLLGLALIAYRTLGKDIPIRKTPEALADRVGNLLRDGIDKQARVTYAVAGKMCAGTPDGVSLLRIAFKPGELGSFLPGPLAPASRLAAAGLTTSQIEGGVLGVFPADAKMPCTTLLFIGVDELVAVQASGASGIDAWIREARVRAATAPVAQGEPR